MRRVRNEQDVTLANKGPESSFQSTLLADEEVRVCHAGISVAPGAAHYDETRMKLHDSVERPRSPGLALSIRAAVDREIDQDVGRGATGLRQDGQPVSEPDGYRRECARPLPGVRIAEQHDRPPKPRRPVCARG